MAYLKVGNVQGNPRNANLGNSKGALESYRKGVAITDTWPVIIGDVTTRRPIALLHEKMADVEAETNQIEQAVENARTSLSIFQELAAAHPDSADAQRSAAISHLKVGDVLGNPNYVNSDDQRGAMENYQAAARILESLHSADPADVRTRRFLGIIHERIGAVFESQKDVPGTLADYQRSAEIRVPLAAEFPNDVSLVRDAAIAYEKLANIMTATGNREAALENRRRSLEIFRNLLQSIQKYLRPAFPRHQPQPPRRLVSRRGECEPRPRSEAIEHYRQAVTLLQAIRHADPANAAAARDLKEAEANLGSLSAK